MIRLNFDTETDGLLREATKLHCICLRHVGSRKVLSYHDDPDIPRDGSINDGLDLLALADELIAHNLKGFDLPVLLKLYPDTWAPKPGCILTDTLRLSKLHYSDLKERDRRLKYAGFPGMYIGSHSLGAWGMRLGNLKGDYSGGWESFNLDMLQYCQQDTNVLATLHVRLTKLGGSEQAWALEDAFADEIERMNQRGVMMNVPAIEALTATLSVKEAEVEQKLREAFPDFIDHIEIPPSPRGAYPVALLLKEGWVPPSFTATGKPRLDARTLLRASTEFDAAEHIIKWREGEYTKERAIKGMRGKYGVITKEKHTVFNPGSRTHLTRHLKDQGWEPNEDEFTPTGLPILSEAILGRLDTAKHPQAPLIVESLMLDKRLGQVSRGKSGWLKLVGDDDIMRPYVNHIGAITFRCSHSGPNVAQTVAVRSMYGKEMRACWTTRPGYGLLGSDASSVELCILAHYLAPYDGGAMCRLIESGADLHTANQIAAGLDTRDIAKMTIYATLYGMLAASLGKRLGTTTEKAGKIQAALLKALKVAALSADLHDVVRERGYLVGLDGRHVPVRTLRSALNTIIQVGAALLVKQWTVLVMQVIRTEGIDAHLVMHVQDELQLEVRPKDADRVAEICKEQMILAGQALNLNVPTTADTAYGANWSETH
jgi:DNA polymerase-1